MKAGGCVGIIPVRQLVKADVRRIYDRMFTVCFSHLFLASQLKMNGTAAQHESFIDICVNEATIYQSKYLSPQGGYSVGM